MTDKEILQSLCEILISNDRDRWCELVENGTKEQQKDFLFNKEKHCFSALFDKYISLQEKLNTLVKDIKWIEEQADTSTQDDYDAEVILKNIVRDCGEALAKIKELDK